MAASAEHFLDAWDICMAALSLCGVSQVFVVGIFGIFLIRNRLQPHVCK